MAETHGLTVTDAASARQSTAGVRLAYREDGQRRERRGTVSSQARRTNSVVVDTNPLSKVLPRPKPVREKIEEEPAEEPAAPEPEATTAEDAAESETVAATPAQDEVEEAVPAPPVLTVSQAKADENASEIVFNLVFSRPLEKPILVLYATYDQTAISGEDYKGEQGTLKLSAGDNSATVRIPLIDDDVTEGDETLELFVTADKSQATVEAERTIGTIMNDDE